MKIRTFKKLDNQVYRVSIYTEDWSQSDIQLMTKFAEPEINVGGEFGDSSPADFELDDNYVRIKSESPFAVAFDGRDYEDAQARADTWADTIVVRIEAAIAALRAQSDGFTTEEVVEV